MPSSKHINIYTPPFFHTDLGECKELIYKYADKITYPANKTLVSPDDIVNNLYFIEQGRVRYLTISSEGMEKVLLILEEGAFFGVAPMFGKEPSSVLYAVTEVPSIIYQMNRELTLKLLNSSTIFRDALLKSLSDTMSTLLLALESLSFDPCKDRLYNLLHASIDKTSLVDNCWYNLKYQYSHDDMAKIIGSSRVTVTNLINELCREDKIRIVNRRIQIKDDKH